MRFFSNNGLFYKYRFAYGTMLSLGKSRFSTGRIDGLINHNGMTGFSERFLCPAHLGFTYCTIYHRIV